MTLTLKTPLLKKCLLGTISVFLGACSHLPQVTTNVDPRNVEHYFAPSTVKILNNEAELNTRYKLLGLVEGDDCQIKPHNAIPDITKARTIARRQAYDLGANAIIFTSCSSIQTQQCHTSTVCFGKALLVTPYD